MNMSTEIGIMLIYALLILSVCFLGKWLLTPGKLLLKLLLNSLAGGLLLLFINAAGTFFAFHIPLNFLSILIVGVLGFPGLLLLLLL